MQPFFAHLVRHPARIVLLAACLLAALVPAPGAPMVLAAPRPIPAAALLNPVLERAAPAPAAPQVAGWSALANTGLNNTVNALAAVGDDLYVGGDFTQTADGSVTSLNYIARYDTATNTWSPLANNGLNSSVHALAVVGDDLYVGGDFTQTADGTVTALNYIAKYYTTTNEWKPFAHDGLNGVVYAIAVYSHDIDFDLYIGGSFSATFDGSVADLNRIAMYSGDFLGAWSALSHKGLNSIVYALAVDGDDLYVGGGFTRTSDGAVTNLNRIALYNGGLWSALAHNGLNSYVYALAVRKGGIFNFLYVGGDFTQTADGAMANLNNIAEYRLGGWQALPNNGLNNAVFAIFVVISSEPEVPDLYIGGNFIRTKDGTVNFLNNIARFSLHTDKWSALINQGLNGGVDAFALIGSKLYVGGLFTQTYDTVVADLNKIASYPTDKIATTTTLISSLNPSIFGQPVTFTAMVAPSSGSGTPTGTVRFSDGEADISGCEGVALNASAYAECTPASLTVGAHTITAEYSDDSNYNASTGTLTQVVNSLELYFKNYLPVISKYVSPGRY